MQRINLHEAANSGGFGSGRMALVAAGAWGGGRSKVLVGGLCLTECQHKVAVAIKDAGSATTGSLAALRDDMEEEPARAWAGRVLRSLRDEELVHVAGKEGRAQVWALSEELANAFKED